MKGGSSYVPAPRIELKTGLDTQAADPKVDEVQYSIVCDDCGKHFWSRSKADSHGALTAHVLHEEFISPQSPVIVGNFPAASSASAPDSSPPLTSAIEAEASPYADTPDSEDSENDEYSICFDCGRHFWSHEAANNHAKTGHMHDTEMVPSSAPDMYDTSAVAGPAVTPTSLAASLSISPSPHWTRPIAGPVLAHTYPKRSITSRASNFGNGRTRSPAPSPDSDRNIPASAIPSVQHVPPSINIGTQTIFTPTTTAPPSPSSISSCKTLKHSQVEFSPELFSRVFFIIGPSGNRKGPSFIMGLPEAQNAVTFRAGVRARLESQGEQVGLREIIARPSWLPVPVYADTNDDHHLLLLVIKNWPEWQKTNGNTSCHVFVTLEDQKEDKEGQK